MKPNAIRPKAQEDGPGRDPCHPFPTLGCVLMASGMGARFGGNKLLASFCGQPLIKRILAATDSDLFVKRIVVTRHAEVAELCRDAGIEAVLHDQPYRSDTVRIGLERFGDNPPDGCMFCPCDQPLLSTQTVEALARAFIADPDHIWRTAHQGAPGSPVVFPRRLFPALRSLPQGMGGAHVIRSCGEQVRLVQTSSIWELRDVDTPQDLELLQNRCDAT